MADNVVLNSGTGGATLATDDVSGTHYQIVKISTGALDSSGSPVSSTNPLPAELKTPAGDSAMDDTADAVKAILQANDGVDIGDVGIADVKGTVSTNNSSTSTLTASSTFTGTGEEVTHYASIKVSVYTDQDSAANGMKLEFSSDNTNWDVSYTYTVTGNTTFVAEVGPEARYFRVVFTNGGTGQSFFRLQTIFHPVATQHLGVPVGQAIGDEDNAQLVKSVITADTGSGYQNIQATNGGNLKVVVEEIAEQTPTMNTGNAAAGTQRVVLASDQPAVAIKDNGGSLTVDNGGTFATQVDSLSGANFAAVEGSALPSEFVVVAGDDGTDTHPLQTNAGGDLKVTLDSESVTVSGTVTADAGTGFPSVATDGSSAQSTGIQAMGTDGTNAQTLSTNSSGHLNIADGGNTITVDGTVTANAGTGTFTVQEASALDVSAAVVSVDDNGGSLTVDGTVTANLSSTDNTVLDNIDTNTSPSSSHYRNVDANAEASIKGSAGTLHWLHVMNLTASVVYVHLYDATTGNVTPGSTTPDFTFPVPTQGDTNGAGFALPLGPNGHSFANAITLVVTTTNDGSAGDPGTNGVFVNAGYS